MIGAQSRPRVGPVQVGVILLALATAVIHLYVFLIEGALSGLPPEQQMGPTYQVLFVGNFLGFVTLALALYLPIAFLARFRPAVRVLMISMAFASVASYFHVGFYDTLGNVTQGIEVLLIVLLAVDASLGDGGMGTGRPVILAVAALVLIVLVLVLLTLTDQIFPPWKAYF